MKAKYENKNYIYGIISSATRFSTPIILDHFPYNQIQGPALPPSISSHSGLSFLHYVDEKDVNT